MYTELTRKKQKYLHVALRMLSQTCIAFISRPNLRPTDTEQVTERGLANMKLLSLSCSSN